MTVGTAAGPFIISLIQGASGYKAALQVNVVVLLLCAGLALSLGPYLAQESAPSASEGRS